jgi:hypothetical protein
MTKVIYSVSRFIAETLEPFVAAAWVVGEIARATH